MIFFNLGLVYNYFFKLTIGLHVGCQKNISASMLKTLSYFKHMVAPTLIKDILHQCNRVIAAAYGSHVGMTCLPDLVIIAKDCENRAAGILILHFAPRTRAWEIGTMAAMNEHDREEMLEILINGSYDAIRALQARGEFEPKMWLVKRVRDADSIRKKLFSLMGFDAPSSWMERVLSDDGYIPFDPFDTVLMKRVIQA